MPWSAKHRFARIAPRKARLVTDLIRGRRCDEAVEILRFTPKRAAYMVRKVLQSAMENANLQEANMNRLIVAEARVDGGPIIKRFNPKDRGRAHPIMKRTSHIVIGVAERN
ncbi:50S ribosomal protein L22 [Phycisphaerae bacterium RAS1]|nr:50S ribosomal protein L22 [Phycisphaerae bacterium RAS1]